MEFHIKIQELRKRSGMTQEEVAEQLNVSRTAVSKWESGRGYPNLDSLKAVAELYHVSVDALLSNDELLSVAAEDGRIKRMQLKDQIFGLLDLFVALLLFLPFLRKEVMQP